MRFEWGRDKNKFDAEEQRCSPKGSCAKRAAGVEEDIRLCGGKGNRK